MTKKTQTTDKKATLVITSAQISAAIKKKYGTVNGKAYTAKRVVAAVAYIKRGQYSTAWDFVAAQCEAGMMLQGIKLKVGKKDYNKVADKFVGFKMADDHRSYMPRLAEQDFAQLKKWYAKKNITLTFARSVFTAYCKDEMNKKHLVNPPKYNGNKKEGGAGTKKPKTINALNMDFAQALKLVNDLFNKNKDSFTHETLTATDEALIEIHEAVVGQMMKNKEINDKKAA